VEQSRKWHAQSTSQVLPHHSTAPDEHDDDAARSESLVTRFTVSPVIVHLGFDPIWFGIIIVCVVEVGLIGRRSE
jgi:hypothetical protein